MHEVCPCPCHSSVEANKNYGGWYCFKCREEHEAVKEKEVSQFQCPACELPIPDETIIAAAASLLGKRDRPGSKGKPSRNPEGRTPRLVTYQGRQQTVRAFCAELGINRQQLYRRMKKEQSR